MSLRSWTELSTLSTLEERFRYLALSGGVGLPTFGGERFLNQQFYTSGEWRSIRNHVIARDSGCDLGVEDFPIFSPPTIHHMNPITREQILDRDPAILDPEFLITVSHRTHNAIHYGDERQLPRQLVVRTPNDTAPWKE